MQPGVLLPVVQVLSVHEPVLRHLHHRAQPRAERATSPAAQLPSHCSRRSAKLGGSRGGIWYRFVPSAEGRPPSSVPRLPPPPDPPLPPPPHPCLHLISSEMVADISENPNQWPECIVFRGNFQTVPSLFIFLFHFPSRKWPECSVFCGNFQIS